MRETFNISQREHRRILTIRLSKGLPYEQTGLPIYQATFLMSDVDEPYTHSTSTNHMMIESHHVGLIEFVADGYSFGIGGIFVDREENLILVPEKFLLNPSFKKFFAELCSDDPKNCIVEAFTISSRFTF